MDKRNQEEILRIKTDFSLALGEIRHGYSCRENDPVFAELQEADMELQTSAEKDFHFEWKIADIDESHIYISNKANGHRYHISVIYPAALYVDVYRILDDGTESRIY